jgi:pyruvate kinase
MPVIAIAREEKYFHQLSLVWGVIPLFCPECNNSKEAFKKAMQFSIEKKIISFGDVVVVAAGVPFGQKGIMNMMVVDTVGDILVRAVKGFGPKVSGFIHVVLSSKDTLAHEVEGKILVLTYCDHTFLPLLEKAKGVVLQNTNEDRSSETYLEMVAHNLKKPVLFRAHGAISSLKPNEEITLDPEKGLIYRGVEESMQFSHFPE